MNLTQDQRAAMLTVMRAVIDTVREAGPMGAPGGHIYAALMTQGASLQQYESLMSALVRTGKLARRGQCYHIAGA
jgi:hypothetical protein